ncbi:MAG TPA: 1-(5-phosphoribosyl)-5-amino-4-imidazole-carboxylate carboxylase, partial [Thermodesulfovibrionales bacterium]|nr:1-(5-phosphoribosyl)-5-amino-4-imidazole-carboxylate carboxylase [Thermodesulfovibrionales bacterium]
MHSDEIRKVIESLKKGNLSVEKALERLKDLPYEDISFAKVDHHRHLRQGIPEVILAKGKSPAEIRAIARAMLKKSKRLLITKATREISVSLGFKDAVFYPASGIISVGQGSKRKREGVLVVSAGTSDIPVAEEAAVTASFLGSGVDREYDVGVAGIHRLLDKRKKLSAARVIVVVAGMEG